MFMFLANVIHIVSTKSTLNARLVFVGSAVRIRLDLSS